MSYIEINTTWTVEGNGGGGNVATGRGTAFNTDTKQIEPWGASRNLAILDPQPPNTHFAIGLVIYWECSDDYTATKWIYDGGTATHIEVEPQSGSYCGYTPPLTCDLGTLTVRQTPTATGVTLTALLSGKVNGQGWYSLDGGTEQSSPTFLSVAVGPHKVHVRDGDLAGCTVEVELTVAPLVVPEPEPLLVPAGASEGVDFVGQPLWYAPADVPPGARVEVELYAETAHGAEDFALVLPLRQLADAAGQVRFRLDTLLWPLLRAFVPPLPAQASERCTSSLVNYFLRTAIYAPGQPVVHRLSPLRTALRGGLPAEWQGTDYFAYRLSDTFEGAPFLSWQPLGAGAYAAAQAKPVVQQQPEWLFWLCPANVSGLRIVRSFDLGPGTEPVVQYEPLDPAPARGWQNQLLAIPMRAASYGFQRLCVQVQNGNGQTLSPPAWYTFVAETPRTRYLIFSNSLGGLDTLRCEGRLEATLDATTEQVERPARFGEVAATADRQVSDRSASRKLKLATGWLSPLELAWLQELVLTRELWQALGNQLRPLDWPKRTLATYSDEPGLRGLLLEFDYAFSPTAYAPGTY